MNILFTADPELPVPPKFYGGIERIVDGLISELRSRGHQVGLVAQAGSTCSNDYFRAWPGNELIERSAAIRNTAALFDSVRTFKPDVLHSFSRLGYLLPLLPNRTPKIMSYQRPTGGWRNTLAAKIGGDSFAFTACSEHIAIEGRKWGGQWRVIPNFVNTDVYEPALSVAPDAPLVFLSRIERIKGLHTAIELARKSGRRLIIAGNKVDIGEGPAYWKNEIAPKIDNDQIRYVGPVNDEQKRALLCRAAALVVPIEWDEPFGIVFVEALACGTPVITRPRGATPEIIEHGVHGYLINTVEEGISAVEKLREISRQRCRECAEQTFSASVVAAQYLDLYGELIARAHA